MTIELDELKSPTLNKAELISLLNTQLGVNSRECEAIVETFFALMSHALVQAEPVQLMGFGTFKVRSKPPRIGRNIRAGKPVEIPAKSVVTFGASGLLKARFDGAGENKAAAGMQ